LLQERRMRVRERCDRAGPIMLGAMISLRQYLPRIGIYLDMPFSYRSFYSRPNSLRQAIRWMDAPQNWAQVSDVFRDDFWTDEVQGVAWDGANWIFSCNANQKKPGANDKALYVFQGGQPLGDDNWLCRLAYKDVPQPSPATHAEGDDHWGQLTWYNGFLYVSHFWGEGPGKGRTNVVVFRDSGGVLAYDRWVQLKPVQPSEGGGWFYPEFQGINPWDGLFYTCRGGPNPREFYLHEPEFGRWKDKRVLKFAGGENQAIHVAEDSASLVVDLPSDVQGACFSPNGHIYVACDARLRANTNCKAIACFSALNGHLMGIIPVLAEDNGQELEGICHGNVSWADGRVAQVHAILLENRDVALDNIFLKSFAADRPEVV
jgi:hypothetical protein